MTDVVAGLLAVVIGLIVIALTIAAYAAILVGSGFLITQGVVWALRATNVIP